MTWVRKPRGHECRMPILWPWVRDGDVWECDSCGKRWRVVLDRHAHRFLAFDSTANDRIPPPPFGPGPGNRHERIHRDNSDD